MLQPVASSPYVEAQWPYLNVLSIWIPPISASKLYSATSSAARKIGRMMQGRLEAKDARDVVDAGKDDGIDFSCRRA
jgi:hypothetical protein